MKKRDAQITVRIPAELRDELQHLAEAEHRSLASYIALALAKHVDRKRKT